MKLVKWASAETSLLKAPSPSVSLVVLLSCNKKEKENVTASEDIFKTLDNIIHKTI